VEIVRYGDLCGGALDLDWATLGMIGHALAMADTPTGASTSQPAAP
jgi:hypothetical protein